ncbi:MAG TPA: M28 family peptidase [Candidatus Angelobacter sp.]|nr:M28 family peptidase [Candidatus Angelobacter sp.]
MKELFLESGCLSLSEQSVPSSEMPNVVCRLTGESEETIIVGANFGQISPDNWAGASLLPSLYQSLASRKRRHTFIFVAFADEEKTPTGARFFADHMTDKEVKRSEAMIDLDALGWSPTKFWAAHSDKSLIKALVVVMYALKLPASQVDIAQAGDADSEAFASRHIPQITLHSLTREAVAVMRSQQELAQKFRPNNYYDSYHLISGYLAYLDETLKARPAAK